MENLGSGFVCHPEGTKPLSYGTAGFRGHAEKLSPVVHRTGVVAALRSLSTHGIVGVCITASHNPADENGVKIIDPTGHMLSADWEPHATCVVNTHTVPDLTATANHILEKCNIEREGHRPVVLIGRDTRVSGKLLATLLSEAVTACGGIIVNVGVATTPAVHWAVEFANAAAAASNLVPTALDDAALLALLTDAVGAGASPHVADGSGYDVPGALDVSLAAHTRWVVTHGGTLLGLARGEAVADIPTALPPLHHTDVLDCANGVGAVGARALALSGVAPTLGGPMRFANTAVADGARLNVGCGADFVKTSRNAPGLVMSDSDADASASRATSVPPGGAPVVVASLDGDADRLVISLAAPRAPDAPAAPVAAALLDGDRSAVLLAVYVKALIDAARVGTVDGTIAVVPSDSPFTPVDPVVVHTSYTNGAAVAHLNASGVRTVCVPTGVKHLIKEGVTHPVAVCFEANGHGTILFSGEFVAAVNAVAVVNAVNAPAAEAYRAQRQLAALTRLLSQTVGDALCDLIAIDAALSYLSTTAAAFMTGYYADNVAFLSVLPVPAGLPRLVLDARETALVAPDNVRVRVYRQAVT